MQMNLVNQASLSVITIESFPNQTPHATRGGRSGLATAAKAASLAIRTNAELSHAKTGTAWTIISPQSQLFLCLIDPLGSVFAAINLWATAIAGQQNIVRPSRLFDPFLKGLYSE